MMRLASASGSSRSVMAVPDEWITEPNGVALERFYHALGVMQARWAVAELQLQRMAWFVMGVDAELGGMITFDMGNVARTNLILAALTKGFPSTAVEFFEFCVRLFHANRENRNLLAHCRFMHVTNAPPGALIVMQSFSAKEKIRARMYAADLGTLRAVADEIEAMNVLFADFFGSLETAEDERHLGRLAKPALPRNLADRVPSYEPGDPQQRVSFPASDAPRQSRPRKPSARERRDAALKKPRK